LEEELHVSIDVRVDVALVFAERPLFKMVLIQVVEVVNFFIVNELVIKIVVVFIELFLVFCLHLDLLLLLLLLFLF